ncbi:MAG TPA: N-acetylmuramoyl-L-alanine amidase [Ignavibacteriales bacterium]|nr:N-acetylmuramoyl-L-alanine amidase [Ignavibacteriales bacterium]
MLAQEGSIRLNLHGGREAVDLKSINRKGVEFISVRGIAQALKAGLYFSSSNGKIEVKFTDAILKLTPENKFVVLTSRSEGTQQVVQIPQAVIRLGDDLFVPFEFCSSIFSSAAKESLTFNSKLGEITENGEPKETEKPLLVKQEEEKKKEADKKAETGLSDSNYDIQTVSVETKSNGTLIELKSKKKIGRFSSTIKDGTLYLNLVGLSADENKIESLTPEGLVKKINVKKVGRNTQMEFYLAEGFSTSEAFPEEGGKGLLITIHNRMLSKMSSEQEKQKERWALNTVVIDAGHGGKDPGTIGVGGIKEKDINLAIALKLGKMIEENMPDVHVVYTRSKDNFVELYRRGKIANENNGNLFISIHCNATPQKPSNADGFEIYLLRPGRTKEAIAISERENSVIQYEDNRSHYQKLTAENFILVTMAHSSYMRYSEQFSDILNKQLKGEVSIPSNGVKQAGFYVLVGASMPSVLFETGFLSNRKDAEYLSSRQGQGNIAESIYKSIKQFKSEYDKVIHAGL